MDVATLVARAKLAVSRMSAEIQEIERLEETSVELEGEVRDLQLAVRERKTEIRSLENMAAFCTRFRANWSEKGASIDREATELISRNSSSPKAQEVTWCAFKSHPTTFSSAVAGVVAEYQDLREPCKSVSAASVEPLSLELDEMDKAKPAGITADAWVKLAALRRERITCDLNQKLADNLIIKCQSKMQTTAAELKTAEIAYDEKRTEHKYVIEQLEALKNNPNVQVVLPWTQCEADQYDFANGLDPKEFTVLPQNELVDLNKEIRTVTARAAEHLKQLNKIKEQLGRAQWEEQNYVRMCEDIFSELHQIEKFKLDREAQNFLRNGLETARRSAGGAFNSTASQLETEFVEKRLSELERRCGKLQDQIQGKMKENEDLDKKVSALEKSLVHPLSGIDLSSMFTERLEPIWREKQLKELIGLQKDRIDTLERELESLNMRTYPTLLNGPSQP